MNSNQTIKVISERRAARHFSQKDVPEQILLTLLDLANRAPSGFNLQPWHFVTVRDPGLKKLLLHVALEQPQILEAPATVVFIANPHAWKKPFDRAIKLGLDTGAITENYAKTSRRNVHFMFPTGPFGLFGLAKRIFMPLRRLKRPTPSVITSQHEAVSYVRSQTMLAVATFIIAAKSVGLDTCPMEGFDEYRIKKLLNIPSYMSVPVITPVGYALELDETPQSVRIPIEEKVSVDRFTFKA